MEYPPFLAKRVFLRSFCLIFLIIVVVLCLTAFTACDIGLKDKEYNRHILPDLIVDNDTYEDYKECCRENFGSVKANRDELVYYTKLVQDFDKLCDEVRDYCDKLSNLKFEVVEMQKVVDQFNNYYMNDLELLDFDFLRCDDEGRVDIFEISTLASLYEAFLKLADRSDLGYRIKRDNNIIKYTR